MKKWSFALASVIILSSTAFIGNHFNTSNVIEPDGKHEFAQEELSPFSNKHDFH